MKDPTNFVSVIEPVLPAPMLATRGDRFRRADRNGVEHEYLLAKTKHGAWNLVDLSNGMSWCGECDSACFDTLEQILTAMNADHRGFKRLTRGAMSGVWIECTEVKV